MVLQEKRRSSHQIHSGFKGERESKMGVRIRLARFGCGNRPFYRLMAADSKSHRDGKHLEVLGYYDPLSGKDGGKRMGLKFDRVKYWLSVGAQPSEPAQRILMRAGLLPPPPMLAMNQKGGPRHTHPIDPMTGRSLILDSHEADDQLNPSPTLTLSLGVSLPGPTDGARQTGSSM